MTVNRIFSNPLLLPTNKGGKNLPTNVKVDLSRGSRKQLSLLKFEPGQTKLTDYFTLLNNIENIMQKNPELHKVVENINTHKRPFFPNNCESGFCSFLKQFLMNAYQNVGKIPMSRRHDTIIKKFATYAVPN